MIKEALVKLGEKSIYDSRKNKANKNNEWFRGTVRSKLEPDTREDVDFTLNHRGFLGSNMIDRGKNFAKLKGDRKRLNEAKNQARNFNNKILAGQLGLTGLGAIAGGKLSKGTAEGALLGGSVSGVIGGGGLELYKKYKNKKRYRNALNDKQLSQLNDYVDKKSKDVAKDHRNARKLKGENYYIIP